MSEDYIDSYLQEDRSIYIDQEITSQVATKVKIQMAAALKYFEDNCIPKDERIIVFYINDCPGGSVSAGLAIYDAMLCEEAKMKVICSGMVASMAVLITLGGDKYLRYSYPNTEFLLHQPLGGAQGQASDILIQAKHIEKVRSKLYGIIAERTDQPIEKIAADSDRDFILNAEEAMKYGLIDHIIPIRGRRK